jgi:Tat protein secretion system quality control protein TatD with DNase activity
VFNFILENTVSKKTELDSTAITPTSIDADAMNPWSKKGTTDAQKAINGMNSIFKQFVKVATDTDFNGQNAYRQAYVAACKIIGTASAEARASECNRVFHAFANHRAFALELIESGLGYHTFYHL